MHAPAAVSVAGVGKTFRVPRERYSSLKARAVKLFRPTRHDARVALDGVSFEVGRGEFFGVVGLNGSGKSTLLKCIAGIYAPDAGSATVGGRLSPFLEMGVGFRPELSVRDNVMLGGTILGLDRREVKERLDDIIAFADLQTFSEQKLKNLSTGMRVRLAFSLAVQVDADILLLDEVLAVGDEAFQAKCFAHFEALKEQGRTIIFVSHNMGSIRRFCDRALLLDRGSVVTIGDAETVASAYSELNRQRRREREAIASLRAAASPSTLPPPGPAFAGAPARGRGADLVRMTAALARAEFKLHYEASALGYLWSVMQPLLLFAVLYAVFSGRGSFSRVEHYPLYVLSAVVLWTFFVEATGGGVTSLVRAEAMMRKLRFPHLAIPLSIAVKAFLNLLLNWLVVIGYALASGIEPRAGWLELPLLFLLLGAFTTGVTLLLASLYVPYRDVGQLWSVFQRLLFFGSPIFYVATYYPSAIREALAMTPLVMTISEMRHAFIDGEAPSATALAGGPAGVIVPVVIALVVLAAGVATFRRQAPKLAERL